MGFPGERRGLFARQHQQAYFGTASPAHGRVAPHARARAYVECHAGDPVQAGTEALVDTRYQREEEEELPAVRVSRKLEVNPEGGVPFRIARAV